MSATVIQFTAPDSRIITGDVGVKSEFSMHVRAIGGVAVAWTAVLLGSIEGNVFDTILTHNDTDGDGKLISTGAGDVPCSVRQIVLLSADLGTASALEIAVVGK